MGSRQLLLNKTAERVNTKKINVGFLKCRIFCQKLITQWAV